MIDVKVAIQVDEARYGRGYWVFARQGEVEVPMCAEDFRSAVTEVVQQANSLDELVALLHAQRCIEFVRVEEYVVKTFPPRRELTIGVRTEGGSIRKVILTIVVLADGHFSLHSIREPN